MSANRNLGVVKYKLDVAPQQRRAISSRILELYPDRIPVIVEKVPGSRCPDLTKKKFIVPGELSLAKFLDEVRKHVENPDERSQLLTSTFLFGENATLVNSALDMSQVYNLYRDQEDGFLYVVYTSEAAFGNYIQS